MKKCLSKLITSVVMGALIVMPVQAAPDTESIQTEIDSAQNEVDSLQTQLRSVLNRIYTLESQMITTGEKIIQATADLESAEELEQQQYEDMKLRIKYLYEEGSNNTLEKLFTSGSFSELLNQAEYIQSLHSYDREMLNEYAATKDKVAELKITLETEMADLETMQTEFSDQQASLNSTISNKQTEASDLDNQLQTAVQATAEEMQVAENTEVQSQASDPEAQSQMDDNQVAAADDIAYNSNINDSTDNTTDVTGDDTSNNTTDVTGDDTSNNTTDDQHQDSELAAVTDITTTVDEAETQSPVYNTEEDAAEDNTNNNNSNNSTDNTANDTSNTTNTDTDSNTNNASSTDNTDNNSTNTDSAASDTSSDAVSSSNTSAAQKIVSAAYTQLGVNYVWGGTSPYVGLDCSGLTQYAHKQAGITIGRTSAVQGAGGKAVTTPQAGDLVCYAGHVGIYIGNGQMIHAPYTGTVVKVQSVYGSPWYRRYW